MKILVVEDDARVSAFLERGLRSEGYSVRIASNGVDGLNMAWRSRGNCAKRARAG